MRAWQVGTGRGRQRSGEWGRADRDYAGEWYMFILDIGINNGEKEEGWKPGQGRRTSHGYF